MCTPKTPINIRHSSRTAKVCEAGTDSGMLSIVVGCTQGIALSDSSTGSQAGYLVAPCTAVACQMVVVSMPDRPEVGRTAE